MSAIPSPVTMDYLPARMLNEFVYCPRLFYYEWVEGVFAHNRETVEGAIRHAKLDSGKGELPPAEELDPDRSLHSRSVTLSSERHGLIAKMDLIEAADGLVTPVDYKRGSPRVGADGELEAWDADQAQLAVQAIVLREHDYRCEEGVLYYVTTKQRVRLAIDEALISRTLAHLADALKTAAVGRIPPPLVDSPKCPRCSLVGICLPDETLALSRICPSSPGRQLTLFDIGDAELDLAQVDAERDARRLLPARDDLRPLYFNTQGMRIGKSGFVLKAQEKEKVVQEVRINEICQVNLFGAVQLTTQAIQALCEQEVPIGYFSFGGWFYGVTHGLGARNVYLRRDQFRLAESPSFCLNLAKALVAGKIRNQRTMLQRNHVEPPAAALMQMKAAIESVALAESTEELLGIEGNAARWYFGAFAGMIKGQADDPDGQAVEKDAFRFDFQHRNRRPPRDPVNALLSLAYSVLSKDLTIVCHAVGLDPFLGFYHQPRFGRAPLALDLMEPFRPLIADSTVLSAINTRMITPSDFVKAGQSVSLTPSGRKALFRAYEQRMDTLVTHPTFGYRVNYRRMLEIQTRLLARLLTGELRVYPVFTTR